MSASALIAWEVPAVHVSRRRNGSRVRIASAVIARQRPGTAKGFVLSMEDETGISNVILRTSSSASNKPW
jgi:error-prone DNA polymerase